MAAFLTHLAIGDRVWATLNGRQPAPDGLGTFLLGCLAPDVDKLCDGLDQGTTHLLAKDRANTYMWQRSQRFLDRQDDLLRAPYQALEASEQALVMGYLCHISVDEITARTAAALRERLATTGMPLPHPDALLTAMDPRLWALVDDAQRVVEALAAADFPDGTLASVPEGCLHALHQIVCPLLKTGGGLLPYLGTVRRQWQWMFHGQVSDAIDDPHLEADLVALRRHIEADLPAAEKVIDTLELEPFVDRAVAHSVQRIQLLFVEEG